MAEPTCLANTTGGTYPPFMASQDALSFDFSVDVDNILYLSGLWSGGVESGIGLTDTLGFSVQRVRPTGGFDLLFGVDTNAGAAKNARAGAFDDAVSLLAGQNYTFSFTQSALAGSNGAIDVPFGDTGTLSLAANVI